MEMLQWLEPSIEKGVNDSFAHCDNVCSSIDHDFKNILCNLAEEDRIRVENKLLDRLFQTVDTAYRDGFLAAYRIIKATPHNLT